MQPSKGTILTLVFDVPDTETREEALARVGIKPEDHGTLLLSAVGTPYSITSNQTQYGGASVPSFQS